MKLTDTAVRNTKPTEKTRKMFDGGGLYLLVNPSGSRLWRLKYRVSGKEKLLAIGAYPAVGLKAARESRQDAKEILALLQRMKLDLNYAINRAHSHVRNQLPKPGDDQ